MQNTCNNNPGKEMGKVRNGLYRLFRFRGTYLIQQDGKQDCHECTGYQIQHSHAEGISDYPQKGDILKQKLLPVTPVFPHFVSLSQHMESVIVDMQY